MKASIVILNWNGGALDCIESVRSALGQDYQNKEVLFVDNASSDGSVEAVELEFGDEINIIHTGDNLGCPGGRNVGADNASGDILFFLENDGYWDGDDVVSGVVELFDKYDQLGILYTKVVNFNDGVTDAPLGFAISKDTESGLYLSASFRGGASACRRDLFNQVGQFPSDFFRQKEERFVSLGVHHAGYQICYCPEFVLQHKGSLYSGKSTSVLFYNCVNDLKILLRRYPVGLLLLYLPLKILQIVWLLCKSWCLADFPKVLYKAFFDAPSTKVDRVSISSWKKFRELTLSREAVDLQVHDERNSN